MAEPIGLEAVLDIRDFQRGVDQYLSELYRLNRDTTSIADSLTASFDSLGRSILIAGAAVTTLAGTLTGLALSRLEKFLDQSVEEAGMLQDELGTIAAVLNTDIASIEQMRDVIRELAIDPKLKVNTFQTAEAMELLARNGIALEDIMAGAARATIAMANATGGNFDESAKVVTDLMNIFEIEADNVATIVGGATAVVNQSKFDLNDYFLAIANGGAVFKNTGGELEDFNAVLVGVSNAFNTGRRAGTGIGAMMLNLVPKSKIAAQAMAALGMIDPTTGFVKFFDEAGAFLGGENLAKVLKETLGPLSEAERTFFIRQIFGIDAQEAVIRMMELGAEGIQQIKKEIANVDAYAAAETRMKTLAGRWEIFLGILEAVRVDYGFRLLPALYKGLDRVNVLLQENYENLTATAEVFGRLADKLVEKFIPLVEEWIPKLAQRSADAAEYLLSLIDSGDAFAQILADLPKPLRTALDYFQRAVKFFGDLGYWVKIVTTRLWEFSQPFVEWLRANVTFEDILTAATIAVTAFLIPLVGSVIKLGAFATAVVSAVTLIRQAWEEDWLGIRTILENVFDFLVEEVQLLSQGNWQAAWQKLVDVVRKLVDEVVRIVSTTDWSALFDNLQTEVETRIGPIFDQMQAEIEARMPVLRAKIEEELKKVDIKGVLKSWWDQFDQSFATEGDPRSLSQRVKDKLEEIRLIIEGEVTLVKATMESYWKAIIGEDLTEEEQELPFINRIVEFRGKIDEEKLKVEAAIAAYTKALKGEPVSEEEINQYPFIQEISTIRGKLIKARTDVEAEIAEVQRVIASYQRAWRGEGLTPEEEELPGTGITKGLGEFVRGLSQTVTGPEGQATTNWLKENVELTDILAGVLAANSGSLGGVFGMLGKTVSLFALAAAGSMLLRKAWETNWAGIRDFMKQAWPEIQSIGGELLKIGQEIWQKLGPDVEAAVKDLLTNIEGFLASTNQFLSSLVEWLDTGDGTKLAAWFETTFPDAMKPSQERSEQMAEALEKVDTNLKSLIETITSTEVSESAVGKLFDFLYGEVVDTLNLLGNFIKILEFTYRLAKSVITLDFSGAEKVMREFGEWQWKEFFNVDDPNKALNDLLAQEPPGFMAGLFLKGLEMGKTVGEGLAEGTEDGFTLYLPTVVSNFTQGAADIIGGLVTGLDQNAQTLIDKVAELVNKWIIAPLQSNLEAQSPSKKTMAIGKDTVQGMIDGLTVLSPALLALVEKLTKDILTLWQEAYAEIEKTTSTHYTAEQTAQTAQTKTLLSQFTDFVLSYKTKAINFFAELTETAKVGLSLFVNAFSDLASRVLAKFTEMASTVTSSFSSQVQAFFNLGKNIVQGFVDGIGSMVGTAQAKVAELVNLVAQATAAEAEIESPSKVFWRLGQQSGAGYLGGFEAAFDQMVPVVARSMQSAVQGLGALGRTTQMAAPVPVYTNYTRSTSTQVTNAPQFGPFQVNNGLDAARLMQMIRQVVNGAL